MTAQKSDGSVDLIGYLKSTGEDLDVNISKKTHFKCNLCEIESCRHMQSLTKMEKRKIFDTAFPSWHQKLDKLFDIMAVPSLCIAIGMGGIITTIVVWDFLK